MCTPDPRSILRFFVWATFAFPALLSMHFYVQILGPVRRVGLLYVPYSLVEGNLPLTFVRTLLLLTLVGGACVLWAVLLRKIERVWQQRKTAGKPSF
jgi:hypothetical protein